MIQTNKSLKSLYIDQCTLSTNSKNKLMKIAKPKHGFWLNDE